MQVEYAIVIKSDIATVWRIFTDLTCWKGWNSVAENINSDSASLAEGKRFRFCIRPFALPMYIEPVVEAVREHRYIVWSGSTHGIHARHEFLFSENKEGVLVTSRETFTAGMIRRILFLFSKGEIHRLSVKMLGDLKEASEKGLSPERLQQLNTL